MMALQWRQARATDRPFLLALRCKTMHDYQVAVGQTMSDADHACRVDYRYDCCYLLTRQDKVVGMLKFELTALGLELMQIQILPAYQGQGIGKAVLTALIDKAGPLPVSLSVLKSNPAERLYRRMGFETVDEDRYEYYLRRPGV